MLNSGVLLIDKPVGITSFDVIRKLRKITGIRKMGHTGTLDPFASGLLIICLGKATRLSAKLMITEKTYTAKMKLGIRTDTGDVTGKITSEHEINSVTFEELSGLVPRILSIEQQVPPNYSALKIGGKKAYQLARENKEFTLEPRPVKIQDFHFTKLEFPEIEYNTRVSKGTYIRVLSETIGSLLNTEATTIELRRLQVGGIDISEAVSLNELTPENWKKYLYPMINLFTDYHLMEINELEREDYKMGRFIETDQNLEGEIVVTNKNEMLGFGYIEDGFLRPRTVLV